MSYGRHPVPAVYVDVGEVFEEFGCHCNICGRNLSVTALNQVATEDPQDDSQGQYRAKPRVYVECPQQHKVDVPSELKAKLYKLLTGREL